MTSGCRPAGLIFSGSEMGWKCAAGTAGITEKGMRGMGMDGSAFAIPAAIIWTKPNTIFAVGSMKNALKRHA